VFEFLMCFGGKLYVFNFCHMHHPKKKKCNHPPLPI
jgi:hypothetical protein